MYKCVFMYVCVCITYLFQLSLFIIHNPQTLLYFQTNKTPKHVSFLFFFRVRFSLLSVVFFIFKRICSLVIPDIRSSNNWERLDTEIAHHTDGCILHRTKFVVVDFVFSKYTVCSISLV